MDADSAVQSAARTAAGAAARPIVVGVDGSDSALAAVRWAAHEARRRHTSLLLVHVIGALPVDPTYGPEFIEMMRRQAETLLAETAGTAAAEVPGTAVAHVVVDGTPGRRLVAQSRTAPLVVIGGRGIGGLNGLLLGSVAMALSAQAACPVVVVRGTAAPDGPVVVGIDGSPVSEAALGFAFEAADRRGVPLVAVHVWADTVLHPASGQIWNWEDLERQQHEILAERLAGWSEKYPSVEVVRRVARDRPAQVLVEQSTGAQLLVVGSRGRGRVAGLVLGSVSHAVLHRAACPVAVVRQAGEAHEPD